MTKEEIQDRLLALRTHNDFGGDDEAWRRQVVAFAARCALRYFPLLAWARKDGEESDILAAEACCLGAACVSHGVEMFS